MAQITPIITFTSSHETAIAWINKQLIAFGLVVRQSFDLQAAKSAHVACTCPHHGTAQCDCQIVVLLVYGEQVAPVTLLIHSQDGNTTLSMEGPVRPEMEDTLECKIIDALGHLNNKSWSLKLGGTIE